MDKGLRGSRGKGPLARAAPVMALYIVIIMLLSTVPVAMPVGAAAHTSSRIIVISNETAIPIALGTPSTGLEPFKGVLTNKVGVYITGQVVDGNYTPIWQLQSRDNNVIADVPIHWSFNDEPDRAHTVTADMNGYFSFYLTPNVQTQDMVPLKFWFDGKAVTVNGIPIYPPAEIRYDINLAQTAMLTVEPVQERALAGDTILVKGQMTGPDGTPVQGEGLMAFFNDEPAQENPHAGWYIDNIILGPMNEDFEDGMDGFQAGGKGSGWNYGVPTSGPKSGFQSFNCAGTDLHGNYEYDTDTWLKSPMIDLTGHDPAILSFDTWSDIGQDDKIIVELSNDDGLTWPVTSTVTTYPNWQGVNLPVGTFYNTPYGTVEFGGSQEVRVRFRLTSNSLPLVTDQDGLYEFQYQVPSDNEAGPATITVIHPGTSGFFKISSKATVNIARMTSIEPTAPESMYRAIPVEVRAGLVEIDGNPVRTQFPGNTNLLPRVGFWLNHGTTTTFLGERAINKNGVAAIGYEPSRTNTLGPASFRFSFSGNEFYSPSEATSDTIIKAHTEVEILAPSDASHMSADKIEIKGVVHVVRTESINDVNQDPVSKMDVQVLLNGEDIGTATTDLEGNFKLEFDAKSSGVNLGNAAIMVKFPGDLVYEPSKATVDFSILSATIIQVPTKTIWKGSTAVIEGTLTSIAGGVQGIVDIEVGGVLFKKIVTGSNGRFATPYNVPWAVDVGGLTIEVSYNGNDVYKPSSVTNNYIVETGTTLIVDETPVRGYRGETVILKGKLLESWNGETGLPIQGASIDLLLPTGNSVQTITNIGGNFTYYYEMPTNKLYFDNSKYLPSDGLPEVPSIGRSDILVTFNDFLRSPSQAKIKLDVLTTTIIKLSNNNHYLGQQDEEPIHVHPVFDDQHQEVENASVQVFVLIEGQEVLLYSGKVPASVYTDFNKSGTYTILAKYGGDQYHDGSEDIIDIRFYARPSEPIPYREQPTVVLGGGLSLIIILAIFMTESGKYVLFKLLLVPMYTKLKKTDVLDHFVRGQIYGLIRMQPGAHYNMIKKKLDLKNGVLSYHLSTLEREGYVLSEIDGIYKRFFPNHVKFEAEYPIFLSKIQERILDFIKVTPGSTQKEVAKGLHVSTSTVNDNIKALKQSELVVLKREGKRTKCFVAED